MLIVAAGILLLSSCKKSFLDTNPRGLVLESNYYKTPEEAFAGLVAVYNCLAVETGGGDNTYSNKLGPLNSAADECWAGGGGPTDMNFWQVWNNYTLSGAVGPQAEFWKIDYAGVFRANLLLSKITAGIPGLSDAMKARFIAEAQFLRAYYYFELVRLFKNIPLITAPIPTSDIYNQVQAPPADVYKQIEKDLTDAIPNLPDVVVTNENGRITKGAGMALLGKAILYQNNNTRMLEAATWFDKVNTSPQYSLLTNYADIFSPDKKFNSESILEIVHTGAQKAGWESWGNFSGNVYVQMTGPRSYAGPKYQSGWSFNPIIPAFVNSIRNDPRYKYTVANIDSLVALGQASYSPGYMNTGYFIEKYAPLTQYRAPVGAVELNYPNDVIEIRLADTYLMEAEALVRGGGDLAKAKLYFDKVRARVGLSPVPLTLDNIYEERRLELATEGHRWFDLVRTGKAAAALAFKGFKPGTNEVLPIPLNDLNNTKLVQNPGYN